MSDNDRLATPRRNGPAVVCFPSSDHGFRNHVGTVLASLTETAVPVTAERLAAEIAKVYPHAIVHEKDELARFGPDRVFYVYRDSEGVGPAPVPWRRGELFRRPGTS